LDMGRGVAGEWVLVTPGDVDAFLYWLALI
jgi:hypothetical protein